MTFSTNDDKPRDEQPSARRRETQETHRESAPETTGTYVFGGVGSNRIRPTLGNISDAVLALFVKAFEKAGADDQPGLPEQYRRSKFELIPMAASAHTNANPALLIGLPVMVEGKSQVLVYMLIFESEQGPSYRPLTDRGEHYDSLVLPEDMLTQRYKSLVEVQFRHRGAVQIVGSQVVAHSLTRELNADKDNTELVAPLFDNAFNAICTHYENLLTAVQGHVVGARITPKSLGKGMRLEKTYDFSGAMGSDTNHLPVRSDIKSVLYLSQPVEGDEGQYYRTELTELRASVDFYVDDSEPDDSRDRGFVRRRIDREFDPFLRAVLNVNSIAPTTMDIPFTLETVLLTLDLATHLTNDYRWVASQRARITGAPGVYPSLSKLDSFPLLNPDPAFRGRINDMPNALADADLMEFMGRHVHDKVTVAMTIPTSSAFSWVMSYFSRLANDPTNRRLLDVLRRAGDTVTGGAFSERAGDYLNYGDNFVRPIATRMLLGTWVDDDGNVRPLSEWNPTAFAAHIGTRNGAYDAAMEFHDTFENFNNHSIDFNLSKRAEILQRNVRGVRIIGSAEQVMFHPEGLAILSEAIADARLDAVPANNDHLIGRSGRGSSSYASGAAYNIGSQSRRDDRRGGGRGNDRSYSINDTRY